MVTTSAARPAARPAVLRDAGEAATTWVLKLLVVFGVLGLIGFDASSVIGTKLDLSDRAGMAASAASSSWSQTHDALNALDAAESSAADADTPATVDPTRFLIGADGTVTVTLRRTAHTFVLRHLPPLRHLADVTATSSTKATL